MSTGNIKLPPQALSATSDRTDRAGAGAVVSRAGQVFSETLARPLAPGLYLVATPIGNLADITLRSLAVLQRADVIYCEDTRRSRILLSHFALSRPLKTYHEHNAASERPKILAALAAGRAIALISDAGTPLVSDPGYKLVCAAQDAGHFVSALPGPSAVLAALTSAGLPTDRFLFEGFLPVKQGARHRRLKNLRAIATTVVVFEAPSRLEHTLQDIADIFGTCDISVARELTKLHEEVQRGSPQELVAWAREKEPKGECVIVIGPPIAEDIDDVTITTALMTQLHDNSVRDAVATVTGELSVARARVYRLALTLKSSADGS